MPRLLPLAVLAVAAPLALVGTQAFAQDVAFYDGNADGQPDTLIPESAWPSWATRGTGSPTVVFDHRIEYVRWDNTPATALSGLASDNVRRVVQSVSAKHFTSTGEDTMEYAVYMQHVLRPIT